MSVSRTTIGEPSRRMKSLTMRNSSFDWRWLRDTISTCVNGSNTVLATASIATTVDFPADRLQLSSNRRSSPSSTSTCHGSGSSPRFRINRTAGGFDSSVLSGWSIGISFPKKRIEHLK
jgi:hypothetical protein